MRNARTAAKRKIKKKFDYGRSLSKARKKKRSEIIITDMSKKSPTEFEQSSSQSKLNKTEKNTRNQRPENSRESSGSSLQTKKFKEDDCEWRKNLSMMIVQLGHELKNENPNNHPTSPQRRSTIDGNYRK